MSRLGGAVFLLIGVLGFVPGVTAHPTRLNIVHLIVGTAGIVVARTTAVAVASLGLWLLGAFAAGGWLSLDTADNWLHFVLAAALLGSAALVRRQDLPDDLEGDLGGRLPAEV